VFSGILRKAQSAGMPSEKLEFQKQEPSFLRKLREQHGGPRNNIQHARPKKDRLRTGEDGEDDPVIVDEAGEDVGKEEWEERLRREKEGATEEGDETETGKNNGGESTDAPISRQKQKTADIGSIKKRKAAKVIGEDEPEQETKSTKYADAKPKAEEEASEARPKEVVGSKPKKKAKKIKLSFDEPE
jgi:hypothetical protein